MTQLGSPATAPRKRRATRTGTIPAASGHGSRLARRRRVLLGVGIAAALLAAGGLIGASFVKSPQQLAADTAAPPPTQTTALVVSQVLTSSVQMRGVVYPATEYDVYPSAPESDSSTSGAAGSPAAGGGTSASGGGSSSVYISRLDVAAGDSLTNGQLLAEIDGQPLFALAGPVPAWRDLHPRRDRPGRDRAPEGPGPAGLLRRRRHARLLRRGHRGSGLPLLRAPGLHPAVHRRRAHVERDLPAVAPGHGGGGERRDRSAAGPAVPGAGGPRVAGADRRAAARLRGPGAATASR